MLTLHRTFDDGKPTLYIADGTEVKKLTGAKVPKWFSQLKKGDNLLLTSGQAHTADEVLLGLAERGIQLYTFHWHRVNLPKGQEPGDIAAMCSALPDTDLRPVVLRPDLCQLRDAVRARTVLLDVRKAAANRLGALQRNSSGLINDILEEEIDELSEMKQQHEISANKAVAKLARRIPECQMLAQAAGVKNGWLLISTIVAYVGATRHDSVAWRRSTNFAECMSLMVRRRVVAKVSFLQKTQRSNPRCGTSLTWLYSMLPEVLMACFSRSTKLFCKRNWQFMPRSVLIARMPSFTQ